MHTPDDTDRPPPAGPSPDRAPASRTAAAGREFLLALGGDAAALAARLRRFALGLAAGLRRSTAARVAHARASLARAALARAARRSARTAAARSHDTPRRTRSMAPWTAAGQVVRRFVLGIGLGAVGCVLALCAGLIWALHVVPLAAPTEAPDQQPSLMLEAANGETIGRVGPVRTPDVALADFSPLLIQAVLSIEDHRFYHHFGVDPLGIIRAAHRNAQAGGIQEGGSTITQQLAKQRYVGNDRTYGRKLREAVTAVWLEAHLGKDEILTRYLNGVYLGAGAYGMAAAARLYFDKAPRDLTLAQAAMLAGLIKAPSQYNPLGHLDVAQARAATVLDAMVANGAIDAQAAAAAKAAPAVVKVSPQVAPARSWFADWIGAQAASLAGARPASLRVRTTLMPDLQRAAQNILDDTLARQGRALGVSQGALVAMRPDGAVLAMVGGRDYGASQFNRAIEANRQPGSAFKLFVYLTALRKGYSPQDTIDASAVDIKGWEPENYGDAQYGRITLAEAFARSVNTAAVRLAMTVGLNNVIATARDLGIETPLSPTPSLALGAYGVSLLDLTAAFASVRADRLAVKPWGVAAVGPPNGTTLQAAQPLAPTRTLGPAREPMVELMRGVVEHGTGRGAALDVFAAGKTGTSQNYRDAWFIGFTDTLVVGVWVGNDDNTPMRRVTGGSLPASIWKRFVTAALPLVAQQNATVAATPATDPTPQAAATQQPGDQAPAPADQASAGRCDPQACAATYRSFNPSDCTYQPYWGGGRRLCDMGTRVSRATDSSAAERPSAADRPPETTGAAGTRSQCNADACARTYSSFDPSDCTYQPFGGGPRQFCAR
ncbi:MAG TPA: PBP1A family penicillin-binding protein [Xanthobacteraceae bacterium]